MEASISGLLNPSWKIYIGRKPLLCMGPLLCKGAPLLSMVTSSSPKWLIKSIVHYLIIKGGLYA